jgi:GT2 family glycosyltransferase
LRRWIDTLDEAADAQDMLPGDWIDAIPSNLIVQADGSCALIDREWRMPQQVHRDLPLYRGLVLLAEDGALRAALPRADRNQRVQWLCEAAGITFDEAACSAAIEVNTLFWREVHANGDWWRADRYRLRAKTIQPAAPRPLDYAGLVDQREPARRRLLAQVNGRADLPRVPLHYVVLAVAADASALQRTLDSLKALVQAPHAISVLGDTPPQDPSVRHVPATAPMLAARLNELLAASDAAWIQWLVAGDTLDPLLPALLAEQLVRQPGLAAMYVDEDVVREGRPADPIFKPDLNLDLLRSYPYIGHALAFDRVRCLELGGVDEDPRALGAQDLLFRLIERCGLQSIGHIAEPALHAGQAFAQWLATPDVASRSSAVVSAHLERLGVPHAMEPGGAAGVNRVRYLHGAEPAVSIIVPTRDQLPMLNGLVDSLLAKTRYRNYELLIVDNDSRDPAACAYLDGIERMNHPQLRVLRWPHPFNYSAINNFAAAQARGEYLVLLNNDTAVLQEDWIEGLLNHAQRPEVGIVGAKLHYPDGRIQHAGVVLGLRGPADHPFIGEAADAPGYMHRLQVDQNYTAVTAACLMIRKAVYDEVGGLDEEAFKVSYNDVDLCLKVAQAGYLNVWTPHVRLMHEGSVSQTRVDTTAREEKLRRFEGEQQAMYRKWLPLLAHDPAYNRNLSLDGTGFQLEQNPNLPWQPFAAAQLPRLFCVPADSQGCGHYRIRQPFLAMQAEGLAEGVIARSHLKPVTMARLAPDAIVLQRQLTESQIRSMRSYRDYSGAFLVYEVDDYLPNLPLKSVHRGQIPKDLLKSMRKAVALTDRLVVSTEPLAEQLAGMHQDIRVVANRLPVDWWGALAGRRRRGARPRVGWAGGSGHRGDLELIADVVRELAGEVEWVFLGMCPEKLRPHVHEFHNGVPIEQYPARLAALDLDLALAPLEDNLFNACKSNLRLLEYGACGIPVVCSDIVCYRGPLPVTRVRNRFKDWVDAIRAHLADLDATAAMGDTLRETVRRDWMLTGANLAAWRQAWLPD